MSSLYAFLHPVKPEEYKEVYISDRFKDEQGNVVYFKVRALTQEENDNLLKKSRRYIKTNGKSQEILDQIAYARRIVVAATVYPDFSSTELCDAYGVIDPLLVPAKMLLTGEFNKLSEAIIQMSAIEEEETDESLKN